MNYGCFNRIWASLDCIRSWRCLNDPNLVTRLLLPGIIRGEQVSRCDISDTISHSCLLSAHPSLRTGQLRLMCLILASVTTHHRPHRPVLGAECLQFIPTFIHPLHCSVQSPVRATIMTIPVSFIIPSNNRLRLDKYLLDVFLSWLWSLMCLITLCRHDGNYLCISENCWWQKSHFIHDKVPGWRLLIKWRLGPLNQHQWGLAWA